MAKPKTGLRYYTIDTDRYQDRSIKRLKKNLGCQGISVYDYILCEIYRVRGYYLEWDDNTVFDVAEYFGIKENAVTEVVNYCASVGLFDKGLLARGIISAASIQRRYLDMCNRAKRSEIRILKEYSLISEECDMPVKQQAQCSEETSANTTSQLTDKEKEEFFKIFFFKNYKNPSRQVERFINHYQATGWTRQGAKVVDRIALAKTWEPKEPENRNRFPHPFMDFWQYIYNQLLQVEDAQANLCLMYQDIQRVIVEGTEVRLIITDDLCKFMARASRFVNDAKQMYYPNTKVTYRLYKKNTL